MCDLGFLRVSWGVDRFQEKSSSAGIILLFSQPSGISQTEYNNKCPSFFYTHPKSEHFQNETSVHRKQNHHKWASVEIFFFVVSSSETGGVRKREGRRHIPKLSHLSESQRVEQLSLPAAVEAPSWTPWPLLCGCPPSPVPLFYRWCGLRTW